jgi:hypothetical protein
MAISKWPVDRRTNCEALPEAADVVFASRLYYTLPFDDQSGAMNTLLGTLLPLLSYPLPWWSALIGIAAFAACFGRAGRSCWPPNVSLLIFALDVRGVQSAMNAPDCSVAVSVAVPAYRGARTPTDNAHLLHLT